MAYRVHLWRPMFRPPATATALLCALLALVPLPSCYIGSTPATQQIARDRDLKAIGIGVAVVVVGTLLALATRDSGGGSEPSASSVIGAVGIVGGLGVVAGGVGGLGLNAVAPTTPDPDGDDE